MRQDKYLPSVCFVTVSRQISGKLIESPERKVSHQSVRIRDRLEDLRISTNESCKEVSSMKTKFFKTEPDIPDFQDTPSPFTNEKSLFSEMDRLSYIGVLVGSRTEWPIRLYLTSPRNGIARCFRFVSPWIFGLPSPAKIARSPSCWGFVKVGRLEPSTTACLPNFLAIASIWP